MLKLKFLGVALLCVAPLCANAATYKSKSCKDGSGAAISYYGDTLPPECSGQSSEQLNKDGRVIKRREVISPESRQASRDADAKKAAEEEANKEAKRRDNALLNTYTNENEIDLARDRSLQQVDARINSYTILVKSAQESLDGHYQERVNFNKQGRTIPKSLVEDIQEGEARVEKYKKELAQSEQEKVRVQERFDADKTRYRKLKGMGQ